MAALQPLLVCETLKLVEIDWNQWILVEGSNN